MRSDPERRPLLACAPEAAAPVEIHAREAAARKGAWLVMAGAFLLTLLAFQLRARTVFPFIPMLWIVAGVAMIRRRAARLRADAGGLHVDGKVAVPTSRLMDAWVVTRRAEEASLFVADRDGAYVVYRIARAEDAAAFAAALPTPLLVTAGRRATTRELVVTVGVGVAGIALTVVSRSPLPMVLLWFVAERGRDMFRRAQVVAGEDGFEIRTWQGRRFVLWSQVQAVADEAVYMSGGERLSLDPSTIVSGADEHEGGIARSRLVDAMKRRFETWKGGPRKDAAAALERAAAMMAATAAAGEGGYRDPAATEEALFRIVESPDVSAEARLRAARAAIRVGPEEARTRVADAARSTASSELEESFARLLDEGPRPRQARLKR